MIYLFFIFLILSYYSIGPHRCNFLRAKMHQNLPYLCLYNLLKTNKIIIIYLKHPFSLECFFSISHYGDAITPRDFYKYP